MDTITSFSKVVQVQCPQCNAPVTTEVWWIIDASERPDLIERCRIGDIHDLACPNGHTGMVKSPLLLRLANPERLLFSPPENTTREENESMKLELIKRLHSPLGDTNLEQLLNQVEHVSRLFLPLVLRGKSYEEISVLKAILQELNQTNGTVETSHRISIIQQAMQHFYREDSPSLWALFQSELGLCYLDSISGDRADNLEQAITAFNVALSVWSPTSYPEAWAETQNNLGEAYRNRILGDRTFNNESAIKAFMDALTVRTREANPIGWAITQNNLGAAYADRVVGERQENLLMAAHCLKLSLEVLTRDKDPEYWAGTLNNLGNVYDDLLIGNRAENIEKAIDSFQSALEVFTRDNFPQHWAMTMNNLGGVYIHRIRGDRSQNVESAIHHIEEAIAFYWRENYFYEWASAQNNLGQAYNHRFLGNRSENLEKAIQAFRRSLEVVSNTKASELWATVLNNLGNTYCDRIQGELVDNIERAIDAYQSALTIRTREKFPEDWATTQSNLGGAYYRRIRGNRATNFERAIEAFEAALTVRVREKLPEDWAKTQSNLGIAYYNRIVGERAENVERAISSLSQALSVFTREASPIDWATIQINLGEALRNRLHGNRAENLDKAIEAFDASLQVYDHRTYPYEWALAQNNLGNTFRLRIRGNRTDNLERAIESFRKALQVYTRENFPRDWALVQNNLGVTYYNYIDGDRSKNMEQAIGAYEAALTVYTQETSPEDWARVQNNLGGVYADRVLGDRSENLRLAAQAFRAALQVYLPDRFPLDSRLVAANLARFEIERKAWREAYTALSIAIKAGEQLYTRSITEEGKSVELEENATLYQKIVEICLRLTPARSTEAFIYAEEARSRILRDQLGLLGFPPPLNLPDDLIEQERKLLQSDRNLENALRVAPNETTRQGWVNKRTEVRSSLNVLWERLIREYGAADYVALRRGERLRWADVLHWLSAQPKQVAILELFMTEHDLIAFVARASDDQPRSVLIDLPRSRLRDISERFFREVHQYSPQHPRDETWRTLGPLLLNKVMPYLESVDLVYIIPHGPLHYLPLHALEYAGKPMIEYFAIAYAPSISVLIRVHLSRKESQSKGKTLVVGNPTGDLPFAEVEATEIARLLRVQPLLRQEAIKAHVLASLTSQAPAHLATHARFNPLDPFASSIALADGNLSAREILGITFNAQLVVVSACETALQDVSAGDELVGLARAFLYAGVPSLILSLWRVNDPATAQLMQYFYTHLFDEIGAQKNSTADALRAAMLEMRQINPQTYYWSPFVLYGDWR